MNTREKIFLLLQQADGPVSGELVSRKLGISRVSVWKHVKGMVESGIGVRSSRKGYALGPEDDSLHPLTFGPRRGLMHHFAETASTMEQAAQLAQQGCPHMTTVVTERQTSGRGRMQRRWHSAEGGLYFTVVVRPDIIAPQAGLVNLAAAVEMAALLRAAYDVDARLKWPNDILVNSRKICGILSQMETESQMVRHINIGIGLNVNNDPEKEEPTGIALRTLLGHPVRRRDILLAFLERFERRLGDFDPAPLICDWKALNSTIGRQVRIATVKQTIEGVAVDIDAQGALLVQTSAGKLETVIHGDCFHR